jgi:putative methyltransferase
VLLYELLLGPHQKIRGGGALRRQIVKKEVELRDVLEALKQNANSAVARFPRYVRVNTLKCTIQEAVSALQSEHQSIFVDAHVPNLLVLPPEASKIHSHDWVQTGKLILQDKSSCFSALCLIHGSSIPLLGDVLDACAAPGNKTSHLASLVMSSKGTVFACDRNEKRIELLQRRVHLLVPGKDRVIIKHVDFLATKHSDFPTVKGILLDPSCSGSGIFTSLDRLADDEETTDDRIQHLSNFQLTALRHAMSFPSVERIVYSTCSVREEENEKVVQQALKDSSWQLCSPHCLSSWSRRGNVVPGLTKNQAECVIRADRGDETNGFFVAYFERKTEEGLGGKSEKAKHTDLIVVPTGFDVYKGEFASGGLAASENAGRSRGGESEEKRSPKQIASKKRAKKLAWKQKQLKQKQERLLKKQAWAEKK